MTSLLSLSGLLKSARQLGATLRLGASDRPGDPCVDGGTGERLGQRQVQAFGVAEQLQIVVQVHGSQYRFCWHLLDTVDAGEGIGNVA